MKAFNYLILLILVSCGTNSHQYEGMIMTVRGPIAPTGLGITLEHEHGIVDFIGAEKVEQPRYNHQDALDTLLPYFSKMKDYGVQTFMECTPNYIGRDVRLLEAVSEKTGLNILTNTGYYAAANKNFVPDHAYRESARDLATRWIDEWLNGINGTDIKPGFIKLGVGNTSLDSLERKIVTAGALTHLATGLKIAIHTGSGTAALDELEIVKENGVDPSALIVVHAQNASAADHVKLAGAGAWVSLDGVKDTEESLNRYTLLLVNLRKEGLLRRALISQDAYWSVEADEEDNIYFEHHGSPYSAIFEGLIPSLKRNGFTQQEIDQLLIHNPAEAFTIEKLELQG
jgi:phosphotriesterase-related protein